jgi:hypothetical protein
MLMYIGINSISEILDNPGKHIKIIFIQVGGMKLMQYIIIATSTSSHHTYILFLLLSI